MNDINKDREHIHRLTVNLKNEMNDCRIDEELKFENLNSLLDYCVDLFKNDLSNYEYYKFIKLLEKQSDSFRESASTVYNNLVHFNNTVEVNADRYMTRSEKIFEDYRINKLVKRMKVNNPISTVKRYLSRLTIDIIQYNEIYYNRDYSLNEITSLIYEIYSTKHITDVLCFCLNKNYFYECLIGNDSEHFDIYSALIFSMYIDDLNKTLTDEKHINYLLLLDEIHNNISLRDDEAFQDKLFEFDSALVLPIYKLKCLKEMVLAIAHFKKHNLEEEYNEKLRALEELSDYYNDEKSNEEIVEDFREYTKDKPFYEFFNKIVDVHINNSSHSIERNILFDIYALLCWKDDKTMIDEGIFFFFSEDGKLDKNLIAADTKAGETYKFSTVYAFLCLLAQSIFFPYFSTPFTIDNVYVPINKLIDIMKENPAVSNKYSDIEEMSYVFLANKFSYSGFDMYICNIFIACLLNLKNKKINNALKELLVETKKIYEDEMEDDYYEMDILERSQSNMVLPIYTSISAIDFTLNYIKKGILGVYEEPFYEIFINYLKLDSNMGKEIKKENTKECEEFSNYIFEYFYDSSDYSRTTREFYKLFSGFDSYSLQGMSNLYSKISFDEFVELFVNQLDCETLSEKITLAKFKDLTRVEQELIIISSVFYMISLSINPHREQVFKDLLRNSLEYAKVEQFKELVDILEDENEKLQSQVKLRDNAVYKAKKEKVSSLEQKINQVTESKDEEIRKLKKEIDKLNKELDKQRSLNDTLTNSIEELFNQFDKEETNETPVELKEVIGDYKISIIGGRYEVNDELRRRYPNNIKTTESRNDYDASLVKNADFIFIMTKFNNHGFFYKFKKLVAKNQKWCFINSDNIDIVENEIAKLIINSKQLKTPLL